MSSLELQFLQYQKQQRGEYRLAKHQPRKAIGEPYEPNRIIVVGSDFAQRCRDYYGESSDEAPPEVPVPRSKEKLARARRRQTEARRLEWTLKK